MNYEVVIAVRKRPEPSFFAASSVDAPLGKFYSDEVVSTVETIDGQEYTTTWARWTDGDWIPLQKYDGSVVYVIELEPDEVLTVLVVYKNGYVEQFNELPKGETIPARVVLEMQSGEHGYVPE